MSLFKRRVLLIIAIFIFVISAPLIIIYTLGYKFNPISNDVTPTGGVYFKIIPKGVKIFFDGELKKENTLYTLGSGLFIKDLPEKKYQVEIQKQGYHSWRKEISVRSSLVTEFKHVLLLSDKPKLTLTSFKSLSDITGENKIKIIEGIFGIKINNFVFDKNYVFFNTDKSKLYQFDNLANKLNNLADNVVTFTKDKNKIYYFDSWGTLFLKDIDKEESQRIAELEVIPNDIQNLEIKTVNGLIAVKYNGNLYLFNQESSAFQKIDQNIQEFGFDDQGTKLFYLKENNLKNLILQEIWVYYLESRIQPFLEAHDKSLIYSTSSRISSVFFVGQDQEHLIFVKEGEGVLVIEIDNRGGQNVIKWLENKTFKIFYKNNFLYIEDKNKVFSTNIF